MTDRDLSKTCELNVHNIACCHHTQNTKQMSMSDEISQIIFDAHRIFRFISTCVAESRGSIYRAFWIRIYDRKSKRTSTPATRQRTIVY